MILRIAIKLLIVCTAVIFTNCKSQKSVVKYNINAHIKGEVENRKVYLRDVSNQIIDSTVIKNNQLNLKGKSSGTGLHVLVFEDKKQRNPNNFPIIPFFLEKNKVSIETNMDSISTEFNFRNEQYNFGNIVFKNSTLNDDFKNYNAGIRPFVDDRKVLFRKYLDHLNYGDPYKEIHYGISIINSIDSIVALRASFVKDYIVNNKDSYMSLYALEDNMRLYNVSTIDSLLQIINPKVLNAPTATHLLSNINRLKSSSIGTKYTDLQLKDDKGNDVLLSNHVGNGKYVLLEFWASWCVPCRADIPHLKKNYELYNAAGFEIISISMDTNQDSWLRAVQEEKMPWLQLSELKGFKGNVSKQYHFSGVPTCILIDPNGYILTRNMRGSWMDQKLIELFGDKFSK